MRTRNSFRAGQMAECLSALAALTEDQGSVFSTGIRHLATACNSGVRGSDSSFWPL